MIENPPYLKFHYIYSLSYYVQDLIEHIVNSPNSDYFEMILHHLLSMMLITCSYLYNLSNFGSIVLVQMDIADIFIGLIRVFMDFCNKYVTFIIYLGIMWAFVYFRFVCFTTCVFHIGSLR